MHLVDKTGAAEWTDELNMVLRVNSRMLTQGLGQMYAGSTIPGRM